MYKVTDIDIFNIEYDATKNIKENMMDIILLRIVGAISSSFKLRLK